MAETLKFQLRVDLSEPSAKVAREDPGDPALRPLVAVLEKHRAALKCQYDAFAEYVAAAEREGEDGYPLYAWTKATIENPAKKARYLKSFALYVDGEEVYPKHKADPLEADLQPLVGSGIVLKMSRFDTDPKNNPQPPARYRT